jgi:phosphatidate cytidylyltransferase
MVFGAYYGGPDVLIVVMAGTVLTCILWRMPRGQDGFVRDVTAVVFCIVYLPFLASFVALLLAADDGVERVLTFIFVTIASDIGGYCVGVLIGRHPMAPVISPKKSWEGFAGSAVCCMAAGVACIVWLLDDEWWVGIVLGAVVVVAATLGDLAESLIKRDLGIKDMSNILPGHGGIMDRLDSLLATVSVAWLVMHFLLPAV